MKWSAAETSKMLKVDCGKQTKGRKQALEWLSKFKSGVLIYAEDAECSACP
jgi:hypothetical protein